MLFADGGLNDRAGGGATFVAGVGAGIEDEEGIAPPECDPLAGRCFSSFLDVLLYFFFELDEDEDEEDEDAGSEV